ncbi:MAG: hypothetical protein IJG63_06105 [Oscillospiraceae bacterium]|nr:hypothetical protein [Oscillospiraceae bacterium]
MRHKLLPVMLALCLALLAGCGQSQEDAEDSSQIDSAGVEAQQEPEETVSSDSAANREIYTKSAWTALQYSEYSDGNYEDVMSIYYGEALFFDGGTATLIEYERQTAFDYEKTADGFTADIGGVSVEALIDGDSMVLKMQGHTWIMAKTDIDEAVGYARSIVGVQDITIPFENGESGDTQSGSGSEQLSADYDVLLEDELCTIGSAGASIVQCYSVPESEDAAVYRISITNNSGQTIEISAGSSYDSGKPTFYGSMNGQEITAVVAADATESSPYWFDTLVSKPLMPGETVELYVCAVTDISRFPTMDELADVSLNLTASNHGGEFWIRDYTVEP